MEIEFTDRYGGHAPSWLRGCHGDCEAMGYVPIFMDRALPAPRPDEARTNCETDPRYVALWESAEAKEPSDDGWHFVPCPSCHGTGRVPWWRTLLVLPRWFGKATRFFWRTGVTQKDCLAPEGWTYWRSFVLSFKCAYLADLGLWRP